MKKKDDLESEINRFLDLWDVEQNTNFLKQIVHLFELYDVDSEDDWVEKQVGGGEENVRTIRMIRTVYLISKIAEFYAGKLLRVNLEFKDLWKKMEKQGIENPDKGE